MTGYERILRALESSGRLVSAPGLGEISVSGIVDDSRRVQPGCLFCATKGTTHDGHAFVADAVARGAAAVMVSTKTAVTAPQIVVNDDRGAIAIAAAAWHGHPADRLDLIGVTGTNGKSTTVLLLQHVLNAAANVGALGTLGAFDGHGQALYREGLTTPGPIGLHATLAALVERATKTVVMEVSSHALDQQRVAGIAFRAGVYTNLTHDHLDYHSTWQDYLAAKSRLLQHLQPDGTAVVNADESAWQGLPPVSRTVTFGLAEGADVRASDIALGSGATELTLHFGDVTRRIGLPLIGAFNVSNALAAAAAAWDMGVDVADIAQRLASAPQVPGRMERLVSDPFLILRDYAHTPDALRRAIDAARPLTAGRLIVVFGCGGDRDRKKRESMGRIAVEGADTAVLTSDNPRTEDPERILDDTAEGMVGHAYLRIVDRREAIHRAVSLLREGDCLLLAGKGHETYQVIGEERFPFDEAEIVRETMEHGAAS